MTRRALTTEWSIDLDDSFSGHVVDGDLQLVSPGPPVRTIWIAVWSPPAEQSPEELMEQVLAEVNPDPIQRWRDSSPDGAELRYGSWYPELHPEQSGGRPHWSLYGYTVRRASYAQTAFLVDDPNDLDWALQTWRSLQFAATRAES